jgi:hypothetical protein
MACQSSWATSMPRHRRNRHHRLETETLRPRRGRRLRLLHRHWRKRPLIPCRSRWKRRHLLSHRKHSGFRTRSRVCPISRQLSPESPEKCARRRQIQASLTAIQRSLLPRSNINDLNSCTPTSPRLDRSTEPWQEQKSVTGDDLGATRDAPPFDEARRLSASWLSLLFSPATCFGSVPSVPARLAWSRGGHWYVHLALLPSITPLKAVSHNS